MKKALFVLSIGLLACSSVSAQQVGGGAGSCGNDVGICSDFTGPITAQCVGYKGYPHRGTAMVYAARDRFHPRRVYAYSRNGIDATRMNAWNQQQAAANPWHCNYNYWRWGTPTALVVPPTAAFQTEYSWGVAQTKSIPIYHQFGRQFGDQQGGEGPGFATPPYWPSSTYQFGVYPVRAPH